MTKITSKATQKGNYTVKLMTQIEIQNMDPQDIKNAAALVVFKSNPGMIQVTSVANLSILSQALCALPEVNMSEVNTIIRYVNLLPNGQLLISYFGAEPNKEIIASLTKLAKTASSINGGIFSGYAALTTAMGEEKHFSPSLAIPNGMTNIRVANKHEIVFAFNKTVKKLAISDFTTGQWDKATEINTFSKNVLFLDRVQNDVTNIVTEDEIARGYNIRNKKATEILDQNARIKVLSVVQWVKSQVITTPLGITQEPAASYAA